MVALWWQGTRLSRHRGPSDSASANLSQACRSATRYHKQSLQLLPPAAMAGCRSACVLLLTLTAALCAVTRPAQGQTPGDWLLMLTAQQCPPLLSSADHQTCSRLCCVCAWLSECMSATVSHSP